jgi:DNA-binding MarR family transcriptional regulator
MASYYIEPEASLGVSIMEAPIRQSLSNEDKATLRVALDVLDVFVREHPTIPAQALRVFLLVALKEGLSMSDYQAQSGLSQSVTSRYLLDIGDRNRYMQEGLGWITQRMDPLNRRRHQAMLTHKGRALAHAVVRALLPKRR